MQHGLKMYGYIERLARLGYVMDVELSIDLILQSLSNSYASFVLNYQMNKVTTTIPEPDLRDGCWDRRSVIQDFSRSLRGGAASCLECSFPDCRARKAGQS